MQIIAIASQKGGSGKKSSRPFDDEGDRALSGGGIGAGVGVGAAILGAPGTGRFLAMLELKSALEEDLTTRLGLDRTPPHDLLVERVRAAGLLDEDGLRDLSRLFQTLAPFETMLGGNRRPALERLRDAEVMAAAARVRSLRRGLHRRERPAPDRPDFR